MGLTDTTLESALLGPAAGADDLARERGIKIAQVRSTRGMTQHQLARELRTDVHTIEALEAGETKPDDEQLAAISQVLGVDIVTMAFWTENMLLDDVGYDIEGRCGTVNGKSCVVQSYCPHTMLATVRMTEDICVPEECMRRDQPGAIQPSQKVTICKLSRRSDLNGKLTSVVRFSTSKQRWVVRIEHIRRFPRSALIV